MLNEIPEFDHFFVAYLKDDPAEEPVATSDSAPGVLAKAAHLQIDGLITAAILVKEIDQIDRFFFGAIRPDVSLTLANFAPRSTYLSGLLKLSPRILKLSRKRNPFKISTAPQFRL